MYHSYPPYNTYSILNYIYLIPSCWTCCKFIILLFEYPQVVFYNCIKVHQCLSSHFGEIEVIWYIVRQGRQTRQTDDIRQGDCNIPNKKKKHFCLRGVSILQLFMGNSYPLLTNICVLSVLYLWVDIFYDRCIFFDFLEFLFLFPCRS